jgi:HD superfamily phosphohydrolase YqeK
MLLRLANSRIRQLYQDLPLPTSIARSDAVLATATRRVFRRINADLRFEGLTATTSYNPFGGERKISREFGVQDVRSLPWAGLLCLAALLMAVGLIRAGSDLPSLWILAGLALVSGIAERHGVALLGDRQRGSEIAVSFVPFVFTAVAFGPLAALVVGTLGNLADFRRPYLRWAVYTPARGLTGAGAGLAAEAAYSQGSATFLAILLAALAIRGSGSPFSYPRASAPLFLLSIPLFVPVVAFLVYGYEQYSFAVVATFLVPVLALQRVAHLYQEQREAARGLTEANVRLERANLSFAAALVATLDARDRYTAGHSAAVAIYSRDIAVRMCLSEADQQNAHLAGLVHDIGKIGLPPGLLEKAGPLTLDERRTMQTHSEIGERILSNVDDYSEIAHIVRHHHERVDGNGYPDGVSLDDIPQISRIIAVADAYNAMTSDRPYREAMASPVARLRLAQAVGSQFDTTVVAAFEAILATSDEAYRTGRRSDFDFSRQPLTVSRPIASVA